MIQISFFTKVQKVFVGCESVGVISSNHLFMKWHIRFTTVHFTAVFDQV